MRKYAAQHPLVLALYSWVWLKALTIRSLGGFCRPIEVTSLASAWCEQPDGKMIHLRHLHAVRRLTRRWSKRWPLPTLILAVALFASFAAHADCSTNWMLCSADSSVQISSFTMRATEVIGSITASRVKATDQLESHQITGAKAKAVLAKTDQGRMLWQRARTACQANEAGNCQGDSVKAFALLAEAQKAVR